MLFDIDNQLSSAQAFTGGATVSTHSYAKQSADQCISIGRLMAVLVIPTIAAGAGSTQVFDAIQADDTALTTNVEVLASVSKLAADCFRGAKIVIPIPENSDTRRYLGWRNTSTGGTTTLTADAYLMPQDEIDQYKSFPKINIAEV